MDGDALFSLCLLYFAFNIGEGRKEGTKTQLEKNE